MSKAIFYFNKGTRNSVVKECRSCVDTAFVKSSYNILCYKLKYVISDHYLLLSEARHEDTKQKWITYDKIN